MKTTISVLAAALLGACAMSTAPDEPMPSEIPLECDGHILELERILREEGVEAARAADPPLCPSGYEPNCTHTWVCGRTTDDIIEYCVDENLVRTDETPLCVLVEPLE